MDIIGWIYIILVVMYTPYFLWLGLKYTKTVDGDKGSEKRKNILWGFAMLFLIFNFLANSIFKIDASYGLAVITLLVLVASVYMIVMVRKDKSKVS